MSLEPFNEKATCPMCGHEEIGVRFSASCYKTWCAARSECSIDFPHLHRACRRCGYDWPEAPITAQNEEKS